jgi:sugar (glycoside-pentoside-hexuronide) transporter
VENSEESRVTLEVSKDNRVTLVEMLGHATAGIGLNLIYGFWATYMLVFYTDVFGITAAAASIIMVISRIWDGINDPMMGAIADRTRTRWGRYRFYIIFMPIVVLIAMTLNFSSPGLDAKMKVIYAGVTYILMSMAFTSCDVPYWSLPSVMSQAVDKRTAILSLSRGMGQVAGLVIGIVAIPMVQFFGQGDMQKGYLMTAIVVGVVGGLLTTAGGLMVKEHVEPIIEPKAEKIGFVKSLRVIIQNKPLLLVLISLLISFMSNLIRQSLLVYYAQYNIGNINLVAAFNTITVPGMLLGIALTPIMSKKIGQKNFYYLASLAGVLVNGGLFFIDPTSNLNLFMFVFALTSLPQGIILIMTSSMIANTIEYAEWKFGQRSEGLISSTQTLTSKIAIALGAGLCGVILSLSRYVPNAIQSAQTLSVLHFSLTMLLAIMIAVGTIPMFFYELTEEKHAAIMKELEERKKN